jgi:hypothetical protein
MGRYRYSRTVRCRHCYEEGHNVKSCKKLEDDVKSNPGGYIHHRYRKYFDEQGNRKKDSTIKKCSYCKVEGHTKRTCDTKLEDMIHNIKTNQEYRKDVYAWFKKKGLGIGALITIHDSMYLVTGIEWDKFDCGNNAWDNWHLELQPMEPRGYKKFTLEDNYMMENSRYYKLEVDSESEVTEPPSEWFQGRSQFYKDYHGRVENKLKHPAPF